MVKIVHIGDRGNPPAGQRYFLVDCVPTLKGTELVKHTDAETIRIRTDEYEDQSLHRSSVFRLAEHCHLRKWGSRDPTALRPQPAAQGRQPISVAGVKGAAKSVPPAG
jgi:hypothetical protein